MKKRLWASPRRRAASELRAVDRGADEAAARAAILERMHLHHDLVAGLHGVLRPALATQAVRAAALDAVLDDLAVGASHVHLDPDVRVRPLEFLDRAFERHFPVVVEHREGVMGLDRSGNAQHRTEHQHIPEFPFLKKIAIHYQFHSSVLLLPYNQPILLLRLFYLLLYNLPLVQLTE